MFHPLGFPLFRHLHLPLITTDTTLSLSVVRCFKIMLGGKLGTEAHVCFRINRAFLSSSTEGLFKSNCYFGIILRRFCFFSSFCAIVAYPPQLITSGHLLFFFFPSTIVDAICGLCITSGIENCFLWDLF